MRSCIFSFLFAVSLVPAAHANRLNAAREFIAKGKIVGVATARGSAPATYNTKVTVTTRAQVPHLSPINKGQQLKGQVNIYLTDKRYTNQTQAKTEQQRYLVVKSLTTRLAADSYRNVGADNQMDLARLTSNIIATMKPGSYFHQKAVKAAARAGVQPLHPSYMENQIEFGR